MSKFLNRDLNCSPPTTISATDFLRRKMTIEINEKKIGKQKNDYSPMISGLLNQSVEFLNLEYVRFIKIMIYDNVRSILILNG